MKHCLLALLSIFCMNCCTHVQASMPRSCEQAVIGIAEGWNSSHVSLTLVEKSQDGRWSRVMGPVSGRLGRAGLAWGLGLHRNERGATMKREGDGRSPAGIFELGGLWVTNPTPVAHHEDIPYVKVGPCDLWITDPAYPKLHNRHVRLRHPATTAWQKKEQMRQTDYPHSIKMLVHHNTEKSVGKPIVGAGSSIFFHIWRRNGEAPTAGCTSMKEHDLRALIARLNPDKKPVYVLLPKQEYLRLRRPWSLP